MKFSHLLAGTAISLTALQIIGAKIIAGNIEDGVRSTVQAYSQQARIPLQVTNFKSGWFSSSFDLSLPIPAELTQPLEKYGLPVSSNEAGATLNLQTNVSHGPIIFNDGLHISAAYASGSLKLDAEKLIDQAIVDESDAENRALLEKLKPQLAKFSDVLSSKYNIDVSFGGDVTFTSDMAGGIVSFTDLPADQNVISATIELSPMTGSWQINTERDQAHTVLKWDGMTSTIVLKTNETLDIQMGAITADSTSNKLGATVWGNKTNANLGNVIVKMSGGQRSFDFSVGSTDIAADTHISKTSTDLVESGGTLTAQDIKITESGNSLTLDSIVFDASVDNIVIEILEAEAKMAQDSWSSLGMMTVDQDPFAIFKTTEFKAAVDKQLSVSPRFTLNSHKFTANGEDIGLTGFVQLNPGATMATLDGGTIAPLLEGDFTFSLSAKMAKSLGFQAAQMSPQKMSQDQINQLVDAQIGQYSQMGILKANGDNFVSEISIKDDLLSVNGKPMMKISPLLAAAAAQ